LLSLGNYLLNELERQRPRFPSLLIHSSKLAAKARIEDEYNPILFPLSHDK